MNHFVKAFLPLAVILSPSFACTKKLEARKLDEGTARKATVTMTASFKTAADLPRCDAGSAQLNAYISERDVFVTCRDFFWRDVKPGDTTGSYASRDSVRFHEWTDDTTKLRWALHKKEEVAKPSVTAEVCSKGWKLPTLEQLVLASANGLYQGIKTRGGLAFDKAWTAGLDTIVDVSKGSLASVLPTSSGKNLMELTAGVYCVSSMSH